MSDKVKHLVLSSDRDYHRPELCECGGIMIPGCPEHKVPAVWVHTPHKHARERWVDLTESNK